MVCIRVGSQSSDLALQYLTAARNRVRTKEAGDELQVALHHFAACGVLLHTPEISDVRSDKYSSAHKANII